MKKRKILPLVLVLCLFLPGCATFKKVNTNRKKIGEIKVGMSRGDVISALGNPYEKEVILLENGESIEFLKYQTSYNIAGPMLSSDITLICLQQNEVIGIGNDFCKNKKKNLKTLYHRK